MIQTVRYSLSALVLALAMALPGIAHAQANDQPKPEAFVLSAASPNPFNPTTTFRLTVSERQEVRVEIYNMLGQPVKRLFKGVMETGETRSFTFDAGSLPTGIYIYRVVGENFTAARQMTLLK